MREHVGDKNYGYSNKEAKGRSGCLFLLWNTKSFKKQKENCGEYFIGVEVF